MIKSITDFFAPGSSAKFYTKVLKDYSIMKEAINAKEKITKA